MYWFMFQRSYIQEDISKTLADCIWNKDCMTKIQQTSILKQNVSYKRSEVMWVELLATKTIKRQTAWHTEIHDEDKDEKSVLKQQQRRGYACCRVGQRFWRMGIVWLPHVFGSLYATHDRYVDFNVNLIVQKWAKLKGCSWFSPGSWFLLPRMFSDHSTFESSLKPLIRILKNGTLHPT